jgi:transcriptional regulator with XRE-family HTH domain
MMALARPASLDAGTSLIMRKRYYSFVRAHRRRCGFSQAELALLLGVASSTTVSRIERSVRTPTATVMVACCILFGLPAPELFTSLHDEIEEVVGIAAKDLYDGLEAKTDKLSVRKREFLEQLLSRLVSRDHPKGI